MYASLYWTMSLIGVVTLIRRVRNWFIREAAQEGYCF
jgi:hypothetical protein